MLGGPCPRLYTFAIIRLFELRIVHSLVSSVHTFAHRLGAGKLLALHNGDGRVLWSRNYPAAEAPIKALTWRTFHDISHAPQVRPPAPTHTLTSNVLLRGPACPTPVMPCGASQA